MDWSNKHLHFHSTHLQQHTLVLNSEPVLCWWQCALPPSLSLSGPVDSWSRSVGLLVYGCCERSERRTQPSDGGPGDGMIRALSLSLSHPLSHSHTLIHTHTQTRRSRQTDTYLFFSNANRSFSPNALQLSKNMKKYETSTKLPFVPDIFFLISSIIISFPLPSYSATIGNQKMTIL